MGGLDWSQPIVKVEDDELNLNWGNDKDEDEDDDDGLTMKKPEAETKADGGSESGGVKLQRENSQVGIRYLESVKTMRNAGLIIGYNDTYLKH